MSGATVSDFLAYWEEEGAAYAKRGDYEWMASLTHARRVLEVGCGAGFGTLALVQRGATVLAVDNLPECLAATRAKLLAATPAAGNQCLQLDLAALSEGDEAALNAFA
ncbi:MAG TPA: class I SAM-dependent methyltransferase, partial [Rhodocyclaceae bacterium]|nr:class I SAM-dependent methyltransferase [Rhodocyclaceae bacterium]